MGLKYARLFNNVATNCMDGIIALIAGMQNHPYGSAIFSHRDTENAGF
jgi:hypothetical protein